MMRPQLTIDDRLNAFCKDTDAYLEGVAGGPLSDLTFAAKDIFDVVGYVTGGGNPDWKATHEAATRTAWVVSVLVAAGATMVGKTITDEITRGIFGENAHYGTPLNPRAPGRVPGGSSSGSASAVAGELVDFALGSDTGGSVRVPSSFCGLYGLRPTHGRIPLDGILLQAPSYDTIGWFARDADLFARVGSVLLQGEIRAVHPRASRHRRGRLRSRRPGGTRSPATGRRPHCFLDRPLHDRTSRASTTERLVKSAADSAGSGGLGNRQGLDRPRQSAIQF